MIELIVSIAINTWNSLKDENLMSEYIETKSVKKQIQNLENILVKHVERKIYEEIIKDYLVKLIPSGTKGVIRGNKFNSIVKNFIFSLSLDKHQFQICFEKDCHSFPTSEKPDWYIREKNTDKIIIGMNQIDLWGGGQQLNRGVKYIENNKYNTDNSKLLCVVCKYTQFKTKNKAYKLFETGFRENTICYLNNLENIIKNFFNLSIED